MKTKVSVTMRGSVYHAYKTINNKKVWKSTGTNNRREAERFGRAYFNGLMSGQITRPTREPKPKTVTFDHLLALYTQFSGSATGTIRNNKSAFLLILRETGVSPSSRVEQFTPEIIRGWMRFRVDRAEPGKEQTARRTVKSVWRQAKSIFKPELLEFYPPLPSSFLSALAVKPLKADPVQYTAPSADLINTTFDKAGDLKGADRNAYIAFLLSACAGMRRNEIAHARPAWLGEACITVTCGDGFRTKSGKGRLVPVNQEIIDQVHALAGDEFILTGSETERAESTFRRLSDWMKGLGWPSGQAAHELRKYFGAQVATKHGLFTAQKLLGHADPTVTSRHYADLIGADSVDVLLPKK